MSDLAKKLNLTTKAKKKSEKLIDFEDLEHLKSQWVATLDAIDDPIAIIDKNYNIIKSNLAMANLSSTGDVKKILSQKCYKIFAGRNKPCIGCKVLNGIKKNQSDQFIYTSNDNEKIFEISSFPIKSQNTDTEYSVQIYRDRTLHTKMQERMMQHDKLTSLGLLAAGISEKINNPLSSILLFSQMLIKELPSSNTHYQDMIEIEAAAQRCKEIVNQILEFSRQGSYDVDKKLENIQLKEIISSSLRFSQVLKVAKECKITMNFQNPDIEVLGCKNRLIQVFLHIFNNAFLSMPEGGELTIIQDTEIYKNSKRVKIEIKDTGKGIKKEHITKIFDPFFTTKPTSRSSGLGLAICYGIIKELGGDISVSSILGYGSQFFVYLKANQKKKTENLTLVKNT